MFVCVALAGLAAMLRPCLAVSSCCRLHKQRFQGAASALISAMLLVAAAGPCCVASPATWEMRIPQARKSDFASLGSIQHWTGSVDTHEDLDTALKQCSFRKEVVIISTTDVFVDAAAQTIWMLRCACMQPALHAFFACTQTPARE